MFQCHVCGSEESHQERVSEVFQINGKFYLVENIPATVCSRCGEEIFSRETTERIRSMLRQPVGILIGLEDAEDWWEELLLREPQFKAEIAQARQSLQAGKGIRIEELRAKYTE